MGTMNNISFGFPAHPVLLQNAAHPAAAAAAFCAPGRLPERCRNLPVGYPCTCTHVLKVALGAVVELRIVDDTSGTYVRLAGWLAGWNGAGGVVSA